MISGFAFSATTRKKKKKTNQPQNKTNLFSGIQCLESKHAKKKITYGYSQIENKIIRIAQDN